MLTPTKKLELVRIAVLNSLAAPENQQYGLTATELDRNLYLRAETKFKDDPKRRGEETYALDYFKQSVLPDMVEAGLIVKAESDPRERRLKPYRITDEGRQYLQAAQEKAMSTMPGQRQDWSRRETGPEFQEEVAATLRSLPEFRDSDDLRIREVSQQLTRVMSKTPTQDR